MCETAPSESQEKPDQTLEDFVTKDCQDTIVRTYERLAKLQALPPEVRALSRETARSIGLWF